MSWQASSLLLLALALAAGFGWYEREKPPARVLALVAALAALAVVGRLAFAAIPNVKPTTDIVLFAGYALGAVPGFAVGAITALVSNIFLSQGPWTVWQMAGWGAVGVGGALLARALRGREPNRFLLAAVCGLAGLAFGAWMDVYQWTLGARQDLDSYLVVAGTSLPYNLAHAIGNVVFCLLIGPAFIRALERYRRRLELRWLPAAAAGALLLVALVASGERAGGHAERARRALPAARPELRRRLRRRASAGLEPALQRLDGARPRGGRQQRARRRAPRRPLARRLPAQGCEQPAGHRRDRAHRPAAALRRPRPARLRGPRPGRRDPREAPRRRLDRGLRELHRLRDPRPALGGRAGGRRHDPLARRQPERRRRLRRRALVLERRGHDRGRPAGAGRRRAGEERRRAPGRRLPAREPGGERRHRADDRPQPERAVDRLRRAGPARRRGRRPGREPRALLPHAPAALRRQHRLLGDELADAGVGHGPGARGARAGAAADRAGRARGAAQAQAEGGRRAARGEAGSGAKGRARARTRSEGGRRRRLVVQAARAARGRRTTAGRPPASRTATSPEPATGKPASTLRLDPADSDGGGSRSGS